jgi:hypothetical protein
VEGRVTDETGGALPGSPSSCAGQRPARRPDDGRGRPLPVRGGAPGTYQLNYSLINFGSVTHKDLQVTSGGIADQRRDDAPVAERRVVVVGKRTFANLADAENPAEDLVGIASSASQGAITAKQLDVRPFMRQGEVLETVPGVIITQHSGEGKPTSTFSAASTSITAATSR